MSEKETIEAEVVPTTAQAIAVRQPSAVPQVQTISDLEQSFALAVRQRELLADYIKKQLEPGKHFYEIKGQSKKSLTKEGAEIILLPHGLCPDYEVVSGPEQPPEGDKPYQITVKCTLRRKGDPNSFVGSGIGSAGSHKGTWKQEKWQYVPRQNDKYLAHNATMKMAQKSAMIAATINSTAASEFFTQDMEPAEPPPTATHTKPASAEKVPASVASCRLKLITNLVKEQSAEEAWNYLVKLGWLLDSEKLEQLEDRFVPRTKEQYDAFMDKVEKFIVNEIVEQPYAPIYDKDVPRGTKKNGKKAKPADPDDDDAPWRSYVFPHGKCKGQTLSEMDKGQLWYWWNTYKVEKTFEKDGKTVPLKPETIAKNKELRAMLDEAGKHYEFTHDGFEEKGD